MAQLPDKLTLEALLLKIETLEATVIKLKKELEFYTDDNSRKFFAINKKQGNMQSQFYVSASKIGLIVSNEELAALGELKKTMYEQTAEQINAAASKVEDIEGRVGTIENNAVLELDADGLNASVNKKITIFFESEHNPNDNAEITDEQKSYLCLYDGTYYYYKNDNDGWVKYPYGGIGTLFKQTAYGFEFVGDIALSGKLYDEKFGKGYFEIVGGEKENTWTDFIFANTGGIKLFEVYDEGTDKGAYLKTKGKSFLFTSGDDTYINGNWHLESGATFDLTGTDIVATAVFG